MGKTMRVVRVVMAVLTVAVCLLLCWEAADILRAGNSPENFSAPGVRIRPVYTREDVAARLGRIAPVLYGYVAAAVLALILQATAGERTRPAAAAPAAAPAGSGKGRLALCAALGVLAIGLIGLGVVNGGARDVLVKAVNICTECVGLG